MSRRAIVIVGLLVALAAVGVVVGKSALDARDDRRAGQGEIEGFAKAWSAVRDCLVGNPAASSDVAEALVVREVQEKLFLNVCQKKLPLLRRPSGFSSRNPDVEDGWVALDKAVTRLATEMSWLASAESLEPREKTRADLAAAFAEIDAAHAALRGHAGLSAEPAWPTGAPVPAMPAGIPIVGAGGAPLSAYGADTMGGVLVVEGNTGGGHETVVVRGPTAMESFPSEDVLRALGGDPWGLRVVDDRVEVVAIDATGVAIESSAVLVQRIKEEDSSDPILAVGVGAVRVVVYGDGVLWRAARSKDGGRSFPEAFLGARHWTHATEIAWPLRRAAFLFTTDDEEDDDGPKALLLTPETLASTRFEREGPVDVEHVCFAPSSEWWQRHAEPGSPTSVRELAPGRMEITTAASFETCSDDRWIGIADVGRGWTTVSCDRRGCEPEIPRTLIGKRMAFHAAGKTGVMLTVGDYVFAVRDAEVTPSFRLSALARVLAVAVWNDVPHAVVGTDVDTRLVPLWSQATPTASPPTSR